VTADLPELSAGTLVIRDVDRLESGQQESLERLISSCGAHVRVLSLVRDPLFARVVEGHFSAALYSHLNTVVVELQAPADLP
jgi:DNA-binding NtrC family response regulator